MRVFDFENQVRNLPDVYNKMPDSNNARLLDIERLAVDGLEADIEAVLESLDIEKASGKTLDYYGEMVGQSRGMAQDGQYRVLIKSKILQNFSVGTFPSVLKALYLAFDCAPSEFAIVETNDPCTVRVEKMPFDIATKTGISQEEVVSIIKALIPVGVYVEPVNFEGTFELSASESDMGTEETVGLTDAEGGLVGGELGWMI